MEIGKKIPQELSENIKMVLPYNELVEFAEGLSISESLVVKLVNRRVSLSNDSITAVYDIIQEAFNRTDAQMTRLDKSRSNLSHLIKLKHDRSGI